MYRHTIIAILLSVLSLSACAGAGEPDSLARWRHLDASEHRAIVTFARRAFDAYVTRRETLDPPSDLPPSLKLRTGVFVSTMRNHAPRCCMGTVYPLEPNAAREIIANAVAAAAHDRRFSPIRPGELKSLTLIVSIVGHPRPITLAQLDDLDPERDGLLVRNGSRSGVVLSRETTRRERMLQWGRIRAGAGANTPVELFRLDVVRFVENEP